MTKFNVADFVRPQKGVQVKMIPVDKIWANPLNAEVYQIGNVDMLMADIAENGIRSPLEVVPKDDGYMVISGHRRLVAATRLIEAQTITDRELPCIVKEYEADDAAIALVTANSTARELTDWERLQQYILMRDAFNNKKAKGEIEGRVRAAMEDALGESGGTLARLEYIRKNAGFAVMEALKDGKISIAKAYSAAKCPTEERQARYAKDGFDPGPAEHPAEIKKWIIDLLVFAFERYLKNADYKLGEWRYVKADATMEGMAGEKDRTPGGVEVVFESCWKCGCGVVTYAAGGGVLYRTHITWSRLYYAALEKYGNAADPEPLAPAEEPEAECVQVDTEQKEPEEQKPDYELMAAEIIAGPGGGEGWKLYGRVPGDSSMEDITFERYEMGDGTEIRAMCDDNAMQVLYSIHHSWDCEWTDWMTAREATNEVRDILEDINATD